MLDRARTTGDALSPAACAFFAGIWFGLLGAVVGLAFMVRAAKREGYRTVLHRPVPLDPREVQLERLRHADLLLWKALGSPRVTELTQ